MGYELELKIKLVGRGKWQGLEAAIKLDELCDDGSDPEHKLYVTKEGKEKGAKFRQEVSD